MAKEKKIYDYNGIRVEYLPEAIEDLAFDVDFWEAIESDDTITIMKLKIRFFKKLFPNYEEDKKKFKALLGKKFNMNTYEEIMGKLPAPAKKAGA